MRRGFTNLKADQLENRWTRWNLSLKSNRTRLLAFTSVFPDKLELDSEITLVYTDEYSSGLFAGI